MIETLSRPQPPQALFRSLVGSSISVLAVRGAPIALRKAPSRSADIHFLRVHQGSVELTCEEGGLVLEAGGFVALSGARAIQFRHEHNAELTAIVLPMTALERWLPDWQASELIGAKLQGEARLAFDIARDLLATGGQLQDLTATEVVAEAIARLMARSLSMLSPWSPYDAGAPDAQAEAARRRVKGYCRKNLDKESLSVNSVARALGLSRASLHRMFQGEPLTLMRWVQAERLEACRRALADGGQPQRSLTDIALSWGFKSSAHFSTAFRQRYGQTPREYRTEAHARYRP